MYDSHRNRRRRLHRLEFYFYMMERHPEYRIICLDKLTYAGSIHTLEPVMQHKNFRFIKLDICDRTGVYALFAEEKPDIVVNFVAESHVDEASNRRRSFGKRTSSVLQC